MMSLLSIPGSEGAAVEKSTFGRKKGNEKFIYRLGYHVSAVKENIENKEQLQVELCGGQRMVSGNRLICTCGYEMCNDDLHR